MIKVLISLPSTICFACKTNESWRLIRPKKKALRLRMKLHANSSKLNNLNVTKTKNSGIKTDYIKILRIFSNYPIINNFDI